MIIFNRPEKVNPLATDPLVYAKQIELYNEQLHNSFQEGLGEEMNQLCRHCSVITVGSDARYENWASRVEVVLLKGHDCEEGTLSALKDYITSEERAKYFDPVVEVKELSSEKPLYKSFIPRENEEDLVLFSPYRLMEGKTLYGDPEILREAKLLLAEELAIGKNRSTIKRIRNHVKAHAKVTETGAQEYGDNVLMHFDLKAGISYYDPELQIWSFKQGPLRLVQYTLARDITSILREIAQEIPHDEIFSNDEVHQLMFLPQNTVSKLQKLQGMVYVVPSVQDMFDIMDSYVFFLKLYHISQSHFISEGESVTEFSESKEIKERLEFLLDKCDRNVLLKRFEN